MRIIAILPIVAFWGCSDDSRKSGSCPQAMIDSFEKVIQKDNLTPQEVKEIESFQESAPVEDFDACVTKFAHDERAWVYLHGKEGPSKMAEFERLDSSDKKKKAAKDFVESVFYIAQAHGQIQKPGPQ